MVDAVLGLVEESRGDDDRPMLRGGIASGEALPRVGDWYGRPVNLASRLTSFARRGSVVASKDVHDAVPENGYAWSFAGNRRFKGLGEEVPVYRVRTGRARARAGLRPYAFAGSALPRPAAWRSASALSVFSQVKSWSSRPKWP